MRVDWLPNLISFLRIVLVPFVIAAILQGRYELAFVLFFIAGFSDLLDGFLARHFNWSTRLGSLLDPVADKLLVAGVFVSLAISGLIPVWLAVLVILRDLIIITGASVYNFMISRLDGSATLLSKFNTGVQGLYVLATLATAAVGMPGDNIKNSLGILMVITVVASGGHYVVSWARRATHEGRA